MDNSRDHARWHVTIGDVTSDGNGLGRVPVTLSNKRFGKLPTFDLGVDWKPGMEPADVRAYALDLVADIAEALGKTARSLAQAIRDGG